jgi:hypothetical protein
MSSEHFNETSGSIARLAECSASYVIELARRGDIPHVTTSNGWRLFRREVAERVKAIKAERLARRGRYVRRAREQ